MKKLANFIRKYSKLIIIITILLSIFSISQIRNLVVDDDITEYSGTISYKFARWLTFSVTGGLETRDSNISGLDYDNAYFQVGLEFAYNLGRKQPR